MKITKKQAIVGGAVVGVLILGGVGTGFAIHSANVHHDKVVAQQKAETAKKAEAKREAAAESKAKAALLTAEKVDSIENVSAAQSAVALVKNTKLNKEMNAEIASIHDRIKLETAAKAAVTAFQKDASNATKDKAAHTAVNKLTSPYDAALKTQLNKEIAASEAQAKAAEAKAKAAADAAAKAKAAADAQAKATASANTTSNYASGYGTSSNGSGSSSNTGGNGYTNSGSSGNASSGGSSSSGGGSSVPTYSNSNPDHINDPTSDAAANDTNQTTKPVTNPFK